MTFMAQVRRLLGRAEVDHIDRTTGLLLGHRQESSEITERLASLRLAVADDRHPDLTAAIERRRSAVH